jgi:hypothetical protein
MPSYVYEISYRNQTRTVRIRKSNPKGWIGQVVIEAFPDIELHDPMLVSAIVRSELIPVEGQCGQWLLSHAEWASRLSIKVVEDKAR